MSNKGSHCWHGLRSLFIKCSYTRRVLCPARTFQLLARPSATIVQDHARYAQKSYIHNTRSLCEQQLQSTKDDSDSPSNERSELKLTEHEQATSSTDVNGVDTKIKPKKASEPQHSFREYMRKVTHPVTIITSTNTSIETGENHRKWRGATVSSFNSVTISPEPYVSFNIKKISSTYDAIKHSKYFAVHLLNDMPRAAEIATRFSQGNDAEPFLNIQPVKGDNPNRKLHASIRGQADWSIKLPTKHASLPPQLSWVTAADKRVVIFQMLCEYQEDKTIEVGDHVIVVGKVIHTLGTLPEEPTTDGSMKFSDSLTYAKGSYSSVAESKPPIRAWRIDRGGDVKITKIPGLAIRKHRK